MLSSFHVEHLEKTIRRRSLSLVRTVPRHLMRTSKARFEFSAHPSGRGADLQSYPFGLFFHTARCKPTEE